MGASRAGHASEVIGDEMYIMGGYGSPWQTTTEVYDVRANVWRDGPDMGIPRAFSYSGVLDGCLYVFCGINVVCAHICPLQTFLVSA
jgi:hypothetical protein